MLEGPNNGYDENGRWNGMTREEVAEWLKDMKREGEIRWWSWHLENWKPPSGPS
jgi:hypothetical protein